jgi:uncharacterized protein YyaL (SSP411 family)
MPNRLADQTSPYLLQHKDNPVDWYPWGPAAHGRARQEDKPIFLSIGYAACHWCHVMAHESFADARIAERLNADFICIKVDREERPDLDQVYMNALQIYLQMTGSPEGGGWPLSMFLTPDLQPILGGTYWPPEPRYGRPGFADVVQQVATIWRENRQQVTQQAQRLTDVLQQTAATSPTSGPLNETLLWTAAAGIERSYDSAYGGFGRAPKFPHAMVLRFLLRLWRRQPERNYLAMARQTLDQMAGGGIFDQLGGGFARYSVDQRWLVPHFEKMLYDNALLADAYLDGYLATGEAAYAAVVRATLDYVLRDMTDPAGGFYSSEDADSEGEEGKFYVWTPAELRDALGPDAAATFATVYGVTQQGNFEGHTILHLPRAIADVAAQLGRSPSELEAELALARQKLLAVRTTRVRPERDEKVLVSCSALMIGALARAGVALGQPRYVNAARRAAHFILANLRREDGRLLHWWCRGTASQDAFLDDYACLIDALIALYEAEFDESMIGHAVRLADIVLDRFADPSGGRFFYTANDQERLIARPKDLVDSSLPSGNAMLATALLRLGKLCGAARYLDAAQQILASATESMEQMPTASGQLLLALDMTFGPTPEIVLLGDTTAPDTAAILADLHRRYIPNKIVALRQSPTGPADACPALDPLFAGKQTQSPGPTLLVCENFACQTPVAGTEAILATWDRLEGV